MSRGTPLRVSCVAGRRFILWATREVGYSSCQTCRMSISPGENIRQTHSPGSFHVPDKRGCPRNAAAGARCTAAEWTLCGADVWGVRAPEAAPVAVSITGAVSYGSWGATVGGKPSSGELAVQKADTGAGSLVAKLCSTLATTWTVACQAPLSLGCPRQGYWSGSHCLLQWPLLDIQMAFWREAWAWPEKWIVCSGSVLRDEKNKTAWRCKAIPWVCRTAWVQRTAASPK